VVFNEDRLWKIAKAKYRGTQQANNWVYIITYYNHLGGNILSMYVTPEEYKTCRVLCKLDNEDKVLTVNENNKYLFYTTESLLKSPKLFSYAETKMTKKTTYTFKNSKVFNQKVFTYYSLGGGKYE
jgi:capsular polysaccharide biosynthesis protein